MSTVNFPWTSFYSFMPLVITTTIVSPAIISLTSDPLYVDSPLCSELKFSLAITIYYHQLAEPDTMNANTEAGMSEVIG